MQQTLKFFMGDPMTKISLSGLLVNFLIALALSFILRWHYIKFGRSLSNRYIFSNIFPILTTSTFLVITVVKSSLALSLGLVGALSIVRFRTPIKEPEELAYLFLAIAIGLGIGADQWRATVLVVSLILVAVGVQRLSLRKHKHHNLYLNIVIDSPDAGEKLFQRINQILQEHVDVLDMRRLDLHENLFQGTYYIDCDSDDQLMATIDRLKKDIPRASITFIDQNRENRA